MSDMPKQDPVIPYLTVRGAAAAIDFYQRAFGAVERARMPAEDGQRLMHADLALNGGTVMLADEFPEHPGACRAPETPSVVITLYVPDADAVFERAVAMPLANLFWGQRYGQLLDPFGHKWGICGPVSA